MGMLKRDNTSLAENQQFARRSLADAGKGYTRADFRAKRETLGLSAAEVASELNVEERSVLRWERGRAGKDVTPPSFAWELLDAYEALYEPTVQLIYGQAVAEQGDEDEIILRYWRHAGDYLEATGENRSFGFRNACTREAARRLRADGYLVALRFRREDEVEYIFDEDAAWVEA